MCLLESSPWISTVEGRLELRTVEPSLTEASEESSMAREVGSRVFVNIDRAIYYLKRLHIPSCADER